MLSEEAGFGGNDRTVPCLWCGRRLRYYRLEIDRLVPGEVGGRYVRGNIVPSCTACNKKRNWQNLEPHEDAPDRHPVSGITIMRFLWGIDTTAEIWYDNSSRVDEEEEW